MYDYIGQLNSYGKACGLGVAVNVNNNNERFEGTWLGDKRHGVGR